MSPIVFVHGAGLDGSCWRYQTQYFDDSIAIDLPGHGDSDGPPYTTIAEYADWLGDEIRRTGSEPVALVGHSMGSLVALETAARNPDMVSHLILIGTSARMAVNADLLTAARAKDASAAAMVIKWTLPRDSGYGRPKNWALALANDFIESTASGILANDLGACNDCAGTLEAAAKIRCPTLLILGENDKMTPPTRAQPLAAALGDARIIVVEKVGHMLPLEKAAEVNEAISLFLKS